MIKLIPLLEGNTRWFYHATTTKALPGIVARGLLPSEGDTNWGGDLGKWSEGKVFLTSLFNRAVFYGNAGIWGKEHFNTFKPLLRIKMKETDLEKDSQSEADYFSEIPIRGNFEIFVPKEDGGEYTNWHGDTSYDQHRGEWRPLTKEIASAIFYGEWDGEVIDDVNERLTKAAL